MKATPRPCGVINPNPKYLTPFKFKDYVFPDGMTILIDSREQQSPLFGRYPRGMTVSCQTLSVGDYSLSGFSDRIAVERKQISDLVPYCTSDYQATKLKMQKLEKLEWAGLIIEARESEVYSYYRFSQASPESVRQALASFSIKHKVHIYIGDREHCGRWMVDRFIRYWNWKHSL
jgi:DNA excision repair protein ERCC-4